MAAILDIAARESEILALQLQEEELRLQQDALLAQRLAVTYASLEEGEDDEDVEVVMEVSGALEEDVQLMVVKDQLTEVQNKRSKLAVEELQEIYRYHDHVARNSRTVAEVLEDTERWRARVAQHDATFARRLASIDDHTWEKIGDEIEEPLSLPPPRNMPLLKDEPLPPALFRSSGGTTTAHRATTTSTRAATDTPATMRSTTCTTTSSNARAQSNPSTSLPSTSTRPPNPPANNARHGPSSSGASGFSGLITTWQEPAGHWAAAGPAGASASASSSSLAGAAAGHLAANIACQGCFERFPEQEMTCAGADAASSSNASAGCGHYFCSGCILEYMRGAVKDGKYPIKCPMAAAGGGDGRQQRQRQPQGCTFRFSRDAVLAALQGHPKELQAFGVLEAEQTIDHSMRIYCPHKSCSALLMRPDPHEMPRDTPISCPACQRAFCVKCLIPGWHRGYTCAQFQALPAHLRSAEDAAVLQLSAKQQWKQCPQCQQMVERSEGCNHMLCRCGSYFCYKCGQPYKDSKPTAANVHGTPACGCPLFDVPEEEEQPHVDGQAGERNGAVAPAQWRGGRMVRRRRCRFSASIYDCPYGKKCWYWHEAEDGLL